jgi:hypothetical protein
MFIGAPLKLTPRNALTGVSVPDDRKLRAKPPRAIRLWFCNEIDGEAGAPGTPISADAALMGEPPII